MRKMLIITTSQMPRRSAILAGVFPPLILIIIFLCPIIYGNGSAPALGEEPASDPAPFDPAETRHGFSEFDTMPTVPADTPPKDGEYYGSSHQPPSIDDAPKGLFQHIVLAEDVDEDLEFRRGHLYLPVRPTQQFTTDVLGIYVVFRVFKHFAPYQIFAQLYPQHMPDDPTPDRLDEDIAFLATEDESGYLKLFPPEGGWRPGAYQIHIFVGFEANAVTRMGTLRFSILEPS